MKAVDAANDELLALERQVTGNVVREGVISRKFVTGDGLAKITLYEHVNSIPDDPFADGEVT